MNKKTITALAATIMMGMILPAFGGEGFTHSKTGEPARYKGFGVSKKEAYNPDPIVLTLNRSIYTRAKKWIRKKAGSREMRRLMNHTVKAARLWENVPTARVSFKMGAMTSVPYVHPESRTPRKTDGRNVITLNGFMSEAGRCEVNGAKKSGDGFLEYNEFDINIKRCLNDRYKRRPSWMSRTAFYKLHLKNRMDPGFLKRKATSTVTHELGHALGLNHSWLTHDLLKKLTLKSSRQSVMSHDRSHSGKKSSVSGVSKGRLNPDDVAAISRLYPNYRNRLSRTTGAVRGTVLDKKGNKELYGAHVILVRSGVGMFSRISGYATSQPAAKLSIRNGDFVLDGVPPGTYDLLVCAYDDSRANRSDAIIVYANGGMLFKYADRGFERGWIRGIRVRAGQDFNIGYVRAGVSRKAGKPGLLDVPFSFSVPRDGKYKVVVESRSRIRFWNRYRTVHTRSHLSFSRGKQAYSVRLKPGTYYVSLYRASEKRWKKVQKRVKYERTLHLVIGSCSRVRKDSVEAWRYVVTVKNRNLEPTFSMHGDQVKMYMAGNPTGLHVEADWGGAAEEVDGMTLLQRNETGLFRVTVELHFR